MENPEPANQELVVPDVVMDGREVEPDKIVVTGLEALAAPWTPEQYKRARLQRRSELQGQSIEEQIVKLLRPRW